MTDNDDAKAPAHLFEALFDLLKERVPDEAEFWAVLDRAHAALTAKIRARSN